MNSYRELLEYGREYLAAREIPDAAVDAAYLLEEVSGMNRTAYLLRRDEKAAADEEERFRTLLMRRGERLPLQQILGRAWFMGLEFLVDENVLIPRFDTETLVEEARRVLRPGMRLLDLCTGSGCILLSLLAEGTGVRGTGADVSPAALRIARKNAQRILGEGAKAEVLPEWIESDLYEKITEKYDMIVSNPPYIRSEEIGGLMPEVREHEPHLALDGGADGLDFYRAITRGAPKHLSEGGWLFYEIGCEQGAAVCALLEEEHFQEIKIIQDLAGRDRVVCGRLPNKREENYV